MKRAIILLTLGVTSGMVFSQAPVVSNVYFSQRTDGSLLVDIYYDLSDTDSETKKIVIEASDDNGSTWDLTCTGLTGDVGTDIPLGTGKHVVWDFYADNPNVSGSSFKVRVTASETGTVTGNDGKVYETVKISNQWWMAENLQETKYRDGSDIPNVTDNSTWSGLSTGARCAYDNNEEIAVIYGYLYNWYTVNDARNMAPAGWHVPTDDEWQTLADYLGGNSVAGGKMKEAGFAHWASPNTGATNESGFTALPGGYRHCNSSYLGISIYACYWSSLEFSISNAWLRLLQNNSSKVYRYDGNKRDGYSIRCVRD